MISTNDFRTGLTIEVDGDIYAVVEFQHVKPGKGAAFVRTKLKNRRTGAVVERTFRAGEKINTAHVERKEMQYLYPDGDLLVMMDTGTFEQVSLTREQLGDDFKWLKDNMLVNVLFYNGEVIGVDLPNFVELKVVDTEPGIKGDTATGASKNATLETGAVVQVPLFVETGDVLKIDTRSGGYLTRV